MAEIIISVQSLPQVLLYPRVEVQFLILRSLRIQFIFYGAYHFSHLTVVISIYCKYIIYILYDRILT